MAKNFNRELLSRGALSSVAVKYFEDVYHLEALSDDEDVDGEKWDPRFTGLPDHVEALREELLDWDYEDNETSLLKKWVPDAPPSLENLVRAIKLLRNSTLEVSEGSEALKNYLLAIQNDDCISIVEAGPVWDERNRCHGFTDAHYKFKHPNPAISLGFKIYDEEWEFESGFPSLPFINCFTATVLHNLYPGIVAAPSSRFKTAMSMWSDGTIGSYSTYLKAEEKSCFPWAVMDFIPKGSTDREVQDCYIRTAYSASISLAMLEAIFKDAEGFSEPESIPPVICLTVCGPTMKLWIAYSEIDLRQCSRKHRMVCIWDSGKKNKSSDLARKLYVMFKKMFYWGASILQPQLSVRLQLMIQRLSSEGRPTIRPALYGKEEGNLQMTVSQIVDKLLQLGLDRNNLKDALLQALVQLELQKAGPESKNSKNSSTGLGYHTAYSDLEQKPGKGKGRALFISDEAYEVNVDNGPSPSKRGDQEGNSSGTAEPREPVSSSSTSSFATDMIENDKRSSEPNIKLPVTEPSGLFSYLASAQPIRPSAPSFAGASPATPLGIPTATGKKITVKLPSAQENTASIATPFVWGKPLAATKDAESTKLNSTANMNKGFSTSTGGDNTSGSLFGGSLFGSVDSSSTPFRDAFGGSGSDVSSSFGANAGTNAKTFVFPNPGINSLFGSTSKSETKFEPTNGGFIFDSQSQSQTSSSFSSGQFAGTKAKTTKAAT